jgi:hypothetical protein
MKTPRDAQKCTSCDHLTRNPSGQCQACLGPRVCVDCHGTGKLKRAAACGACGSTGVRGGAPKQHPKPIPGTETRIFQDGDWWHAELIYGAKIIPIGRFDTPAKAEAMADRWLRTALGIEEPKKRDRTFTAIP